MIPLLVLLVRLLIHSRGDCIHMTPVGLSIWEPTIPAAEVCVSSRHWNSHSSVSRHRSDCKTLAIHAFTVIMGNAPTGHNGTLVPISSEISILESYDWERRVV
jgi:hypothetical protein